MFLHPSVSHSVHCGEGVCVAGGHAWGRGECVAGVAATAAGGMHPTGMYSCF